MQVKLKKNETFEKLLRRFKKRVEKDDIIKTFRSNQEFVPKSVARQQKKADKLGIPLEEYQFRIGRGERF